MNPNSDTTIKHTYQNHLAHPKPLTHYPSLINTILNLFPQRNGSQTILIIIAKPLDLLIAVSLASFLL